MYEPKIELVDKSFYVALDKFGVFVIFELL